MSRLERSPKKKPLQKIDPEAYRQSIDRLGAIFADIADHAEVVSKFRCPYRDRLDHCTGKFRCRNQETTEERDVLRCTHDGHFDYRSAWETKPESYNRAKARIKKNREISAAKRETPEVSSENT